MKAYKAHDVTTANEKYTTAVGLKFLGWLVVQPWFSEKSSLTVTERKHEGNRFGVVAVIKNKDGMEKVSAIFFLEGGVMKFHVCSCLR